ncbi:hypothetical protein [Pseudomonas phage HU1]|nr:hypothetical protein [Pseudomonas phage HU1]
MIIPGEHEIPLNELDRVEMMDLKRILAPGMTDEQFAEKWAEFVKIKQQKKLN